VIIIIIKYDKKERLMKIMMIDTDFSTISKDTISQGIAGS